MRDGRRLKDAAAELLRKGLAATATATSEAPRVGKDKKTGLPLILCKNAASRHDEIALERITDLLLAQEVEWRHGTGR